MGKPTVECPLCGRLWKEATLRMKQGKTCSKLCSSIKGYLSGDRKETGIELKLQGLLKEAGIPFVTQRPLLGVTVADIFIAPNVAIFADGTYWHSGEQAQKDSAITTKLRRGKIRVCRLSEELIDSDIEETRRRLLEAYGTRAASTEL